MVDFSAFDTAMTNAGAEAEHLPIWRALFILENQIKASALNMPAASTLNPAKFVERMQAQGVLEDEP